MDIDGRLAVLEVEPHCGELLSTTIHPEGATLKIDITKESARSVLHENTIVVVVRSFRGKDINVLQRGCLGDLPVDGPVDLVVCALGYSVFPDWRSVFANTTRLLSPAGCYVVFDQYVEDLYVADFAADQTRRTWELVERGFERADTRWYGDCFMAAGTIPRRSQDSPADPR